jgi:endoglucanase
LSSTDEAARKGGDAPAAPVATYANALAGARMWIDPASNARFTADAWRATRPADAARMDKVAAQPGVRWIGNWNTDVRADVDAAVTRMTAEGALPVFVAYNIPQRDCGGLSGGSASTSPEAYRSWIAGFAAGIGARRAAVILEPDALAGMDCLSSADQQLRVDLLTYAVQTLRARGSVAVYLDAGNPGWQTPATMGTRLARAGVSLAQGFALNVSNFIGTAENLAYGEQLSALVGGKHFVIDTGRNGVGASGEWCNPAGRALGARPTTDTGVPLVDAYLWVKAPGESDGACGGAAAAGGWMPEYALGLAQRAGY